MGLIASEAFVKAVYAGVGAAFVALLGAWLKFRFKTMDVDKEIRDELRSDNKEWRAQLDDVDIESSLWKDRAYMMLIKYNEVLVQNQKQSFIPDWSPSSLKELDKQQK